MQRAALQIDVPAVGATVDTLDARAQPLKQLRRKEGSRAVGAVRHDSQTAQSIRQRSRQMVQISPVECTVHYQFGARRTAPVAQKRKNLRLQRLLLLIGQFVAGMSDQLDSVVLIRV